MDKTLHMFHMLIEMVFSLHAYAQYWIRQERPNMEKTKQNAYEKEEKKKLQDNHWHNLSSHLKY